MVPGEAMALTLAGVGTGLCAALLLRRDQNVSLPKTPLRGHFDMASIYPDRQLGFPDIEIKFPVQLEPN
jgi:hypothetical protein